MADDRRPVVCLLAYNEEARIAEVIERIVSGNRDSRPLIRVYANGCTDRTHEIVEAIARDDPDVELVVLEKPSKPNAWNRAFHDHQGEIVIFADADVLPEPGAVAKIVAAFERHPSAEIACCESWPLLRGVAFEQIVTGLLQIPLRQDFLIGHFYGIRRLAFQRHFEALGSDGLPAGIAGDDAFLDQLVPRDRFVLVDAKVRYEPPSFDDYYRYLGRIRWQNEQIRQYNRQRGLSGRAVSADGRLSGAAEKLGGTRNPLRLMLGVTTTAARLLFKRLKRREIDAAYHRIGPVRSDGAWVLSEATRSSSVK